MTLFSDSFGIYKYNVSPGFADDGFSVILCRVDSAFKPKDFLLLMFGFNFSEIVCIVIFYSNTKNMQNELSKAMSRIYYSTKGYWKGFSGVSKLASAAKVSGEEAIKWLEKQALWQIYLPATKYIPRPHWEVSKPNMIHQADLLFLLHDSVGRKTYKYALVVVDIATRYKDAEPLTSKESSLVAKAFEKIYSRKLN